MKLSLAAAAMAMTANANILQPDIKPDIAAAMTSTDPNMNQEEYLDLFNDIDGFAS